MDLFSFSAFSFFRDSVQVAMLVSSPNTNDGYLHFMSSPLSAAISLIQI